MPVTFGNIQKWSVDDGDHILHFNEQYCQLLNLSPGQELGPEVAEACRLDVEDILERVLERSKKAYAHRSGSTQLLNAILGELQVASSLYSVCSSISC